MVQLLILIAHQLALSLLRWSLDNSLYGLELIEGAKIRVLIF